MLGPRRRGVAQSGSASGLGPEGRRFESCLPDHLKSLRNEAFFFAQFNLVIYNLGFNQNIVTKFTILRIHEWINELPILSYWKV